ncbi:MAG TPA: YceI family protein [Solirubrobacteraceae bacterium]|nr:YceI family protein [Solirubrobacteraceae bacterium]
MKTGRSGAAAKAGHDLVLEVTSWEATLDVGDSPSLQLSADPTSLKVIEGQGGMQALDDDGKADIVKSIDKDVLKKKTIQFRSTSVDERDGGLAVNGELELAGKTAPVQFDVRVGEDGALSGSAKVKQTDWGMKPYSALFGALKVNDEVEVVVDGKVPTA